MVSIDGQVEWDYQRKLAQKTVGNITGVKAVINNLRITSVPPSKEIKNKIQDAFIRNANVDSSKITISQDGHRVTLKGKVKCWSEKKEAENTVWTMPGVSEVDNQLDYEETFDPSEVL